MRTAEPQNREPRTKNREPGRESGTEDSGETFYYPLSSIFTLSPYHLVILSPCRERSATNEYNTRSE